MIENVTIALLIKVSDGLVIASDSATTLGVRLPDGTSGIGNIYNNANKIFNLHKGLPIGAMTWGLGNIGPASIATLAKDLRRRFSGEDAAHPDWKIDPANYKIEEVAARAREFLYDEHYAALEAGAVASGGDPPPVLGFLVAGYSSDAPEPHAYVMQLGTSASPLEEVVATDAGAAWWGQPEAIARLLNGLSLDVPQAMVNLGVLDPADALALADGIRAQLNPQMVPAAMPIQDAVDLAEFLVHTTIQFVRFSPGSPTVGGPIEIATITKHEDYKWVRRKHFFDTRLNPVYGG